MSGVYNVGQEFLAKRAFRTRQHCPRAWLVRPTMVTWPMCTLTIRSGSIGLVPRYNTFRGTRKPSALDGSGKDIDAFLSLFNSQYSGFGASRYTEGGGLELITLGQMNDSTAPEQRVSLTLLWRWL